MDTLRLLGGIGLVDEKGEDVDALLRQPKHIALLAYLALPRPGTWHRRDSVLGTFWPEHDQARARSALRSALYTLRRHLPEGAITSRGDDELSISPDLVATDVAAMTDDLAAGRFSESLARYQGDLLPGIYIPEADSFDKWLEQERRRARNTARKAATQLSEQLEQSGNLTGAIAAASRAAELDPDDEAAARRWIALLDRAGDRAQAFAVYERFRNHLSEAFGVRPSAETVALLDAVRTRREPSSTEASSSHSNGSVSTSAADRLGRDEKPPVAPAAVIPSRTSHKRSMSWLLSLIPVVLIASALAATRIHRDSEAAKAGRSLVVLPMDNETGDPSLAYVATGIAEDVARRLEGIGGITIRSGARSEWSGKTRHDMETIGREFGPTVLLRSSITKTGDSLEVHASVVSSSTSEERVLPAHRFSMQGIRDVESRLAADVAGAVFRRPIPALPRDLDRPIDAESYRLTLEGWHQALSNVQNSGPRGLNRSALGESDELQVAGDLFTRAINLDPSNARAWSGLSSVWTAKTTSDQIPFDEGYERATAAASRALALDSLQGTAWANLGVMRALKYKDLSAGMNFVRKAEKAEPSNPEIFMIESGMFRVAHLYDQARDAIRVARQLDPLSSYYLDREAIVEFCTDRPAAALGLYETELGLNPSNRLAQAGLTRALAMLGRYNDALASWKKMAAGDTSLLKKLDAAKDSAGYWSIRHSLGLKRLAALQSTSQRVSPLALMQAEFASGNSDAAYKALDEAARANIRALYRLSCMPDVDEFRHTPQFASALARIGALRVK